MADLNLPGGRSKLNPTRAEFRLLNHMAISNRVFERSALMDVCLREKPALERTIDSHISELSRKFASFGADGIVAGLHGVEYRVVEA